MKSPVFISGLRKSGTSLVKSLLDGHPGLFVYPPNELHLFRYSWHPALVKDKLARWKEPRDLLEAISGNAFIRRMADAQSPYHLPEFNYSRFRKVIAQSRVEHLHDVYETLVKAMYASFYGDDIPTSLRPASKTVLETEYFPEYVSMYPDCRFVYVLRNPYAHFVSAVRSMRTHTGRNTKAKTGEGMPLNMLRNPYPFLGPEMLRMRNSYYCMEKYARLDPARFYVLIYDRLLLDPKEEMKKLCGFLEIPFHENLLKPTLLGRKWRGNSWFGGGFDGIDPRPLHHWKKYIHPGEIKLLNRHFSEIIEHYFEPLQTEGALIRPFHPSEYKPWVYLANRLLYYMKV